MLRESRVGLFSVLFLLYSLFVSVRFFFVSLLFPFYYFLHQFVVAVYAARDRAIDKSYSNMWRQTKLHCRPFLCITHYERIYRSQNYSLTLFLSIFWTLFFVSLYIFIFFRILNNQPGMSVALVDTAIHVNESLQHEKSPE